MCVPFKNIFLPFQTPAEIPFLQHEQHNLEASRQRTNAQDVGIPLRNMHNKSETLQLLGTVSRCTVGSKSETFHLWSQKFIYLAHINTTAVDHSALQSQHKQEIHNNR